MLTVKTDVYAEDKQDLMWDIATILNAELRELAAAGCEVIQIEEPATSSAAAYGAAPEYLDFLVDLLNHTTRANTVIFASNQGEAGAINELGRGTGPPIAVSGHSNEWWWGPENPRATTVVAIGAGPLDTTDFGAYLRTFCGLVRVVATLHDPFGIDNQEWGGHVYLCTGLRTSWAALWPSQRTFS